MSFEMFFGRKILTEIDLAFFMTSFAFDGLLLKTSARKAMKEPLRIDSW
jgi:hypothetical protein